ncbi:MAG: nucleotidyltransferase family protein [Flavobacteriaceae bacterium]
MYTVPLLLLAAGKSSRMGTSKQLLQWKDKTLIEHSVKTGLSMKQEVYVVLGAYEKKIRQQLDSFPIKIVYNPNWEQGIGTSIAMGVSSVLTHCSEAEGVFIYLADQPFIDSKAILSFYTSFQKGENQIITTAYENEKWGVPALFDRCYFDSLTHLNKDVGAQQLIKENKENCTPIPFPKSTLVDIDTPKVYQKYKSE